MTLDHLQTDVESAARELGEECTVELDTETRNELALLSAAYGTADPGELLRRAVHELFRQQVETGNVDFHLRSEYDCTYDEYLSGMTFAEMTGQQAPEPNDDRRYQF